jgi:hypothetical protein
VAVVLEAYYQLKQWGTYPHAGGWADQDAHLLNDLKTLAHVRAWREHQLYPPGRDGNAPRPAQGRNTIDIDGQTFVLGQPDDLFAM